MACLGGGEMGDWAWMKEVSHWGVHPWGYILLQLFPVCHFPLLPLTIMGTALLWHMLPAMMN